MMRGSKEQHDELFKQISLETLSETSQGVQGSHPQTGGIEEAMSPEGSDASREGREGTTQARLIYPDLPTSQGMSAKAKYRYDKRIGGWRRVY